MSFNDPIADMLTRIRNAVGAKKRRVDVPVSRLNLALAEVLLREKFVGTVEMKEGAEGAHGSIRIGLKYAEDRNVISGVQRVSTPGRRVYVSSSKLPRVQGGLGTAILSTPQGMKTDKECRRDRLGGEVICYIW